MPKKGYLTKAVMRKMIRNYLKNNDISIRDDTDANSIMQLYGKGNKASIVPLMKSI